MHDKGYILFKSKICPFWKRDDDECVFVFSLCFCLTQHLVAFNDRERGPQNRIQDWFCGILNKAIFYV